MSTKQWITSIDKRSTDRTSKDVEVICLKLRKVQPLSKLPTPALIHMAHYGLYEDLEKGITLFRQGDEDTSWYAVINGSLEVRAVQDKVGLSLCTLEVGSTFGESVLNDLPKSSCVVTKTPCELIRLQQHDLKSLCQKNKDIMSDLINHCKIKNGLSNKVSSSSSPGSSPPPMTTANQQEIVNKRSSTENNSTSSTSSTTINPALPVTQCPSVEMARAGWVLRVLLLNEAEPILRDRKTAGGRHLVALSSSGSELVTWLTSLDPRLDRSHATMAWQALLEEGVIFHVSGEEAFKDKCLLYQFRQDRELSGGGGMAAPCPSAQDVAEAEEHLNESLQQLANRAPDAWLRMIFRKATIDRSPEDLEMIYDELMQMKPLSHLTNSMKRELSTVIMFEPYPKAGTIVFEQGEEGKSWYLILRGSVDVVIRGKGTVATLKQGEDFGKLALINNAPRAATIIVREDNTHLLRVDKEDFNRILKDVEANTVRLKEHGKDVLILEKSSATNSVNKYMVMACNPSRMVDHILESRLDLINHTNCDPALDDFLLTHILYLPMRHLIIELKKHYHMDGGFNQDKDYLVTSRRRVALFIYKWVTTIGHPILHDQTIINFIEEISSDIDNYGWEESSLMNRLSTLINRHNQVFSVSNKWKLSPQGQPISLFSPPHAENTLIKHNDEIIFRVYCADHTYCTLRVLINATAEQIKIQAADKLGINVKGEDLLLVEIKSNGERHTFRDCEVSVATSLTLNGRIFVSPKDHLDALTVVSEQEDPTEGGIELDLENVSAKEFAYHMTMFDWELFWNIHEYELLYHTVGRHRFGQITANLDVFLRRFNELQYWVVTELLLTPSLSKRVHILSKIIKIASYCKELHNINGMFALVLGLSNVAVSRLSLTWDKLPSKARKLYTQLEATIDPSKNHRAYRAVVSAVSSPLIPFMPLLLKDMTFIHEGNKTMLDGLVNFEKMHMLAQTLRTLRYCRGRRLVLEPPTPKNENEVKTYVRCLRTIDNQRTLNSLSNKLEPRRS